MEPFSKHYYRQRRLYVRKRDEVLTDKLLDLSNLGAAALIFSQFQEGKLDMLKLFVSLILLSLIYWFTWNYLSRFN